MAQTFTTTELLVQIREMARISDDEPDADDATLLRKATEVLQSVYAPAVRAAREDYYVTTARIALVANKAAYPIPRRAVTASVRRVRLLDSAGRELRMTQVPLEEITSSATALRPDYYALGDDRILVSPVPTVATYTLEVMFEYRPAQLILPEAAVGTVAAVSYVAASEPWRIAIADDDLDTGDVVDIVRSDAPFSTPVLDGKVTDLGASLYGFAFSFSSYIGAAPSGLSAAVWVDEDSPLGIRTGDYVCTAGESPIPQIPAELHPILAKHTAAAWLSPIDSVTAADLQAKADDELKRALAAMTPRKIGRQMKMRPTAGGIRTRGRSRSGGRLFSDWEP